MTVEEILLWIGGVEMPKGDAARARQAAAVWAGLADRLESSLRTTGPVAADVWEANSGAGIDAFQKFWTTEFAPYAGDVAAYCRKVQATCAGYAQAIDQMRFALTVLAVQTWANIAYTIAYGWVTGWAGTLAELAVIRDRAAIQAAVQKTLFQKIVIKLLEYLIDSVGYAAGQQLVQLGVFGAGDLFGKYDATTDKIFGFDPYSARANSVQFAEGVGANAAFDGTADLTRLGLTRVGPWGGFLSAGRPSGVRNRLVGYAGRMLGSDVYTVVNNIEEGKPPEDWLPTWRQQVDKVIMHGARIAKNPAKGPIGSGRGWP